MDGWQKAAVAVIVVVVGGFAVMYSIVSRDQDYVPERPADVQQITPECIELVERLARNGTARPGEIGPGGGQVLVTNEWVRMSFPQQEAAARCISNYSAGGSDHWIKSIRFTNQETGVTYGVLEGSSYRLP